MARHRVFCLAGLLGRRRRLWPLGTGHTFDIFVYLLFKAILAVAVVAALFLLGMITCGCACYLSALPYVGTVLLLPVPTVKRAFSLHYLRQFGPDFDLFASAPEPSEDQPDASPDHYAI